MLSTVDYREEQHGMPYYDCTYVITNPYSTDPEPDVDNLATRAYNHMHDKAREGWRLVSTATPPGANGILLFWEEVEDE